MKVLANQRAVQPLPRKLNRSLNLVEAISLATSDISPTTGVFANIPVVLALAGTGSFTVALLAAVTALCVAVTMAEIGSAFPQSGGIYSVISRVFGARVGFVALIAYLAEGIFIPAITSMGAATYLVAVFPQLNVHLVAVVIMLLATGIAIMNISATGKFTTGLLVLELLVVTGITVGCLLHLQQPVSTLFSGRVFVSGNVRPVTVTTMFAAMAVMLLSFNGFDSALNFSEELKGNQQRVGRSVITAAVIGIIAQLIPLALIMLAAPSLTAFLRAGNPVNYVAQSVLGGPGHVLLSLGIAVAMFACTIAVLLQFSRVLYTSGRDHMWFGALNRWLQSLHPRYQTPWKATILVGGLGVALNGISNLGDLVAFTAVLIVVLYASIGSCDLVARLRRTRLPYRSRLGVIAPIITIAASLYALSQQAPKNLLISAIILGLAGLTAVLRRPNVLIRKEATK
ncbi:APC family permease [Lactiplantibacillus modestisalitolerans]|uniref:APC family permease n=1 Tax=Lactiplantibacillus modestisalitolerans TaxID=1457219 RepID=A0ABV5WUF6_9LACO|nr:APC family permease [Lactiplantibacillus modestisalitolerans]